MTHYTHHLFFCANEREDGKKSCGNTLDADSFYKYAKDRVKAMNLANPKAVKVNRTGCLGRCDDAPMMVIYPEGTWYTYQTTEDIDEILSAHLMSGRKVDRLLR
ncbi:MAG: NAD(P)H-dependent oxidoreductase subunit E [Burkholderiales bacterium]|jgi:(2Fe-2S) ferredoxin|nr:NAD(P)H-dependent oxidoreductase subunit E [Burkholderiales bacterium]